MINYYHVLGVSRQATVEEVKRAYRKKAFDNHPDRNSGTPQSQDRFRLITEAYRILSNDQSRYKYDYQLDAYYDLNNANAESQVYGTARNPSSKERSFKNDKEDIYRNVSEETLRNARFRKYSSVGPHDVAIAMLIIASIILGGVWLHSVMSRKAAEQSFAEGKYRDALYFDSTYAPSWHAWAKYSFKYKDYQQAMLLNDKAIYLADKGEVDYYQFKLAVSLILDDSVQVLRAIELFSNQDGVSDSVTYLIATGYLNVLDKPKAALELINSLKSEPLIQKAQLLRGKALLSLGRTLEAQLIFDEQVNQASSDTLAHLLRGQARLQLLDTLGACYDFQMASMYGSRQARQWSNLCR